MVPSFCCDCGVKLFKPTANFCPKGHSQSQSDTVEREKTAKREDQGQDQHLDDDDEDIQIVSSSEFQSSCVLFFQPPLSKMLDLLELHRRDASRAANNRAQGSFGIRSAIKRMSLKRLLSSGFASALL
jgi:hypothetical protein